MQCSELIHMCLLLLRPISNLLNSLKFFVRGACKCSKQRLVCKEQTLEFYSLLMSDDWALCNARGDDAHTTHPFCSRSVRRPFRCPSAKLYAACGWPLSAADLRAQCCVRLVLYSLHRDRPMPGAQLSVRRVSSEPNNEVTNYLMVNVRKSSGALT